MRLIDAYTTAPADLRPGDVALFTLKLMVFGGPNGLLYRIYRCRHETKYDMEGQPIIPQGSPLYQVEEIARDVFPVIITAGGKPG